MLKTMLLLFSLHVSAILAIFSGNVLYIFNGSADILFTIIVCV